MMESLIDVVLLGFLAITGLFIVGLRNLFAVVMLFGIYSLISAGIFVQLDAVDVAFTEAAVGAGISTIVMLGTLALIGGTEQRDVGLKPGPLIAVLVTGAALIYGTLDLAPLGDPAAPVHQHVAPRYIEDSGEEIGVPNIVTSVLASYRGYDTLGEVTVIFTAGIAVLILLGGQIGGRHGGPSGRRREDPESERGADEEAQPGERKGGEPRVGGAGDGRA